MNQRFKKRIIQKNKFKKLDSSKETVMPDNKLAGQTNIQHESLILAQDERWRRA